MGPRILLVEDDADIALITSEMLSAFGFRVRAAHSGRDAVLATRDTDFAGAIVDLQLPDGAGWEVAHGLGTAGIPVLFYSVHTDDPDVMRRALDTGATVVDKSADPAVLLEELERLLGVRR